MNLPSFDFNDIISFIVSPSFSGTSLVLKILFIVISFYFIISIIYFLSKTHYFQWLYGESLEDAFIKRPYGCLLYTSPSPRDATLSRMPSSA